MTELKREIVVVGGGLAGFSAAIAFAVEGFATALLAPPPGKDHRSTALLGASVGFLDRLGVLGRLGASAQPLATMRIVDDTGRLLRAPMVEFKAGEIGLAAFGYNVLNSELNAALRARAAELAERLTIVESAARSFEVSEDEVRVDFEGGRVVAALAVAADGRNSLLRREAGIRLRDWHYPQAALVLNFEHDIAHNGVSTEFHTRTGPFTQVPLPGRRSSLVWVERPETAALLVDLRPERLAMTVEEKLHSILGTVRIDGPVQSFPLKGAVAEAMTGRRVALIGETAHVFPPIGAQGLNLGLRDAADLARIAATARDDPGRRAVTLRYEAERRQDVLSRTFGVDLLNRSLLAGYLPIQAARSVGLAAMAAFGPLRRFAMREGTVPGAGLFGLPASMREDRGETGPARVR